jgi:hypothetical protein
MKRKSNDTTVTELIDLMLHQYGLSGKYKEFRLLQSWNEMMGPMVANRTENIYISGKTLIVKLNSPALRSELGYAKSKLVKMLNKEAGEELLDDIVFH